MYDGIPADAGRYTMHQGMYRYAKGAYEKRIADYLYKAFEGGVAGARRPAQGLRSE